MRVVGMVLALLASLPLYSALTTRATGQAGQVTAAEAAQYLSYIWSGTLLVALVAVTAGLVLQEATVLRVLDRAERMLLVLPVRTYALLLAVIATVLAALFARIVLDGRPDLIDSFAQLTHARVLADDQLSGPASPFWHIQQTIVTEAGWVSQYPPGYIVLLMAGFKLGAVWLVGPLLAGVAVFFTVLAAARLLDHEPWIARLSGLLLALSPFAIAQAGSYMSHTAAAAVGAALLYSYARARSPGKAPLIAAGLLLGVLFAIRPYTAVALGTVVFAALASDAALRGRRRAALLTLGLAALPLVLSVALYNQSLFGAPLRFGYTAALGPAGGLGFHTDPWGNSFGPIEALAYTSAELIALSLFLLESPFPLVALIGCALVLQPRLNAQRAVIAAWALVPVAANLFYWHHGWYRGPRMLADTAPAWILLSVFAFAELGRRTRGLQLRQRWSAFPAAVTVAALVLLIAPLTLGSSRLLSYRRDALSATLLRPPEAGNAIVFVHGGWTDRLAARLATAGMRLDSVETALRQNATCAVHEFAEAYEQKRVLPPLDFQPRASGFPQQMLVSPGNPIRVQPGAPLTPECIREVNADRAGVADLTALLWQGALPTNASDPRPLFVRDLGPVRNQELLRRYPERVPYIYGVAHPDVVPRLWPYEGAVKSLWGAHVDR
ncbi:MAG: hypothetical protein ACRERX_21790 [Pseudomonas sp.]